MTATLRPIPDDTIPPPAAPAGARATDGELLDAYSRAVTGAAEQVGPAVVSVEVRHKVERRGRPARVVPRNGPGVGVPPGGLVVSNRPVLHSAAPLRAALPLRDPVRGALVGGDAEL